ncbi:hypothetical protein [Actinokineospora sp. NBRC 105648]|uniref:hypothetical protein n=1 Tax=Actinokineospora sp. NBRC 105648 TaxID=3032206 RepID=UPI0024A1555F|nr:hypothetical protein [Actinokineospora sp. NBRC 105648]GLZ39043.1 hypothetical protein Acsp05_26670 [Actinokineospora sp. NBRC 105648]
MRAVDDNGTELNAEFTLESDGDTIALIMESSGGKRSAGRPPRNRDYNRALELLLRRLGGLSAVITAAMVETKQTTDLSEAERSVIDAPMHLTPMTDPEKARKDLVRNQGLVGKKSYKAGTNTKRFRARLKVPGYGPEDTSALAAVLVGRESGHRPAAPDAHELLDPLDGEHMSTVSGHHFTLRVRSGTAWVVTDDFPAGEPIPLESVQEVLDELWSTGSIKVDGPVGTAGSLVGAVLLRVPEIGFEPVAGTASRSRRAGGRQGAKTFAVVDGWTLARYRTEQSALRSLLIGGVEVADCALCGHSFPVGMLVAAHIKKRSVCTPEERADLKNVAMLACALGCDRLFEDGHVAVGPDGVILVAEPTGVTGRLADLLAELRGGACSAHRPSTEQYFAWHREKYFKG